MKYISKKLLLETINPNGQQLLKALAFAIMLKGMFPHSNIKNFSINKLHKYTGIHCETIRKRINTLRSYKLVHFEGKNLIFKSIVSRHKERNVKLEKINIKSEKSIRKTLQCFQIIFIQLQKDFAKDSVLMATDGHTLKDVKKGKQLCRKHRFATKYEEYGISYKRIAEKLGVSLRTAFNIVKDAVERNFINKIKNYIYFRINNISYRVIEGFTFTTKNYAYIIKANIYQVKSRYLYLK